MRAGTHVLAGEHPWVNPGRVLIAVVAPGFEESTQLVDVAPGEEKAVALPAPRPLAPTSSQPSGATAIGNYGPVLSDAQFWPFGASYFLTPGASHPNGQASLCPGDSGGPMLLSRSAYPGGPAYPTNVVIGVNADYTFADVKKDKPFLSTFNIHTRLSNDAPNYVGGWLQTILPSSSFLWTMDP